MIKKAMNTAILVTFFLAHFNNVSLAQSKLDIAKQHIHEISKKYNLSDLDIKELIVTSQHVSKKSGVEHIYFNQQFAGIEIYNANISVHITKENEILKVNNRLFSNIRKKINTTIPKLNAQQAIKSVAKQLNYNITRPLIIKEFKGGLNQSTTISNGGISQHDIPVKLMYQPVRNEQLFLAWEMFIYDLNGENHWSIRVDANTGKILDKVNMILHCKHSNKETDNLLCPHDEKKHNEKSTPNITLNTNQRLSAKTTVNPSYTVVEVLPENPMEQVSSVLMSNPSNPEASPFGWHDTDGNVGAEYTITRGNNVYAFEENPNNNFSPDGGTNLLFNFVPDLFNPYSHQAKSAAITNAFYWCNIAHDVLYKYGFDEASGNYQQNNYGKGGTENDPIHVKVQLNNSCNTESSFNNNLQTLQLTVCNDRDAAIDNTVIIHEYTHGLTVRLVGGANSNSCISNMEQMGEGWSDYYALVLTLKQNDDRHTPHYFGSWFFNTDKGIRPYGVGATNNLPYTTNIVENDLTYSDIDNVTIPHGVGSIWALMLWEMTWNLIDLHGLDSNLYNGNGGNNIALHLVTEALKLTPCDPGFVEARDAILAADIALYGGANECLIWKAFAKRGLGYSAQQGSSDNVSDGTEAFDVPSYCTTVHCSPNLNFNGLITSDTHTAHNSITSNGTVGNNQTVTFQAGKSISLNPSFITDANNGSLFLANIDDCNADRLSDRFKVKKRSFEAVKNSILSNNTIPLSISIQNIPNPFSNHTTFQIDLKEAANVRLEIYDITGKLMAVLLDNQTLESGQHKINFDASNLSDGIYLYQLVTEQERITNKMVLKK